MLTLVVHEERPEIWPLLVAVFEHDVGIELSQEASWAFDSREDLDAVVCNRRFAYETYGGTPPRATDPTDPIGEAEALNTRSAHVLPLYAPPNMPPWVIALPSISARTLSMEEETTRMWERIFAACERVNASDRTPKIHRLGCSLAFNFWPAGSTDEVRRSDLEAIQGAYRAYRSGQARDLS